MQSFIIMLTDELRFDHVYTFMIILSDIQRKGWKGCTWKLSFRGGEIGNLNEMVYMESLMCRHFLFDYFLLLLYYEQLNSLTHHVFILFRGGARWRGEGEGRCSAG